MPTTWKAPLEHLAMKKVLTMAEMTDQTISHCRGAQWIEVGGRLWALGEDYDRQWEELQRLTRVLQIQKADGSRWQHIDDARELEALRARVAELEAAAKRAEDALQSIGDEAHDLSTGPTVPDGYWRLREQAYREAEAIGCAGNKSEVPK